jgi:dTMP kinase
VTETREPGGSDGAEAIRELLLRGREDRWSPAAEALLFAAARADHVEQTILPALKRGQWVTCDRFVDSSIAYQGIVGGIGVENIRSLHRIGSGGFLPDRTILLSLNEREGETRAHQRDGEAADRFGMRPSAFHSAVNRAFDRLAEEEPERIRRIDAAGSPEEVGARILAELGDLL